MDLAIADGHLKLLPRTTAPDRHMPIDLFFRTLAEVQAGRPSAWSSPGPPPTAPWGSRRSRPPAASAWRRTRSPPPFDGMPRSAIASGCVDSVLPPEGLAREIARLTSGSYVRQPRDESAHEALLDAEPARPGADLRAAEEGHGQGPHRLQEADAAAPHPAAHGPAPGRRAGGLRQTSGGRTRRRSQDLYQDLLINVTSFFRDPEAFAALQRDVFPRLLRDRPADAPVRVWVPGCSTGEEVYSLAICLLESLDDAAPSPPIQIFGTDIRDGAVEKARAGIYLENIATDVSPERLARFFAKVDGHYQVSKAVRDLCVFARHDLIRDPPFSRLDLISCRNVLIYLEPGVQRRVMANFHYALNASGRPRPGELGDGRRVIRPVPAGRPGAPGLRPEETVAHTVPGPGAGTYPGRSRLRRPGGQRRRATPGTAATCSGRPTGSSSAGTARRASSSTRIWRSCTSAATPTPTSSTRPATRASACPG